MSQYEAFRDTLIPVAGRGHWNDLDMLIGGNFGLSLDEARVQMGMWSMHAAPLILSVDLATVLSNFKEVSNNAAIFNINIAYRLDVSETPFFPHLTQDPPGRTCDSCKSGQIGQTSGPTGSH